MKYNNRSLAVGRWDEFGSSARQGLVERTICDSLRKLLGGEPLLNVFCRLTAGVRHAVPVGIAGGGNSCVDCWLFS